MLKLKIARLFDTAIIFQLELWMRIQQYPVLLQTVVSAESTMCYTDVFRKFIRLLSIALEEASIVLKGRQRIISQDMSTNELFVLWGWVVVDKLCL